jgi:enoyl-CoA hydratase/carnithine racemase
LPARCRRGLVAEILFTGDAIDARRALEAGLVHAVVPDPRAMPEAMALAARMARHSAAALRATRRALRLGEAAAAPALEAAGALYVDELMGTRDAHEGLRAFVERRRPAWTHE